MIGDVLYICNMIPFALLWDLPGERKNFIKRKPNVRESSFDDFLEDPALLHGPTPSAKRCRTSSKGPYICNVDFLTNHMANVKIFP